MEGVRAGAGSSYSLFGGVACDTKCSQLVGAPFSSSVEVIANQVDACMVDVEVRSYEAGVPSMLTSSIAGPVKRKRGRPPRGQPKPDPVVKQTKEEEDVCFICFDGGSLVLCDRRGCPKAYHPACIKRDDAFFQSNAKWICGWHLCSTCQKNSSYMCYTCTHSLCKGCTWNADYVCVRGNKGFCGTCLRTVFLIENVGLENKEKVQVDFDDKTSWEYLFKVYWTCLKTELSLTVDELIKAKNPSKLDDFHRPKTFRNGHFPVAENGFTTGQLQVENSKVNNVLDSHKIFPIPSQSASWATKELLEFIAHMRNGDVSPLFQFDVQGLILEYVKRNNLRDPNQKSLIICDSRLRNLFQKPQLGHIEMLKLLEYHFLTEEKKPPVESVKNEPSEAVSGALNVANNVEMSTLSTTRRRKSWRKNSATEAETQIACNRDAFAAIDVHNINLLYLKRSLMETLIDDIDNFPVHVHGSFVRIKISAGDQKFDAYRLVRVVGTTKASKPYMVGLKTSIYMLEILNLDKQEIISIDGISNQEFSEDECRLLRQSIKCGLVKQLTVGEVIDLATKLKDVKVNDVLESEILKLNHLRDRASEKGQRKQLRDFIQKIETLKSPKERQRRLLEIPIVNTDPKLNPSYVSDDDIKKIQEKKPGRRGRPRNPLREKKAPPLKCANKPAVLNYRNGRTNETVNQPESPKPVPKRTEPVGRRTELVDSIIEAEKQWHYQDPTGKIQGPFAMNQLRKWSSNGLFPLDLRVWRTQEAQSDSILLTDALIGRFVKEFNEKQWESGINLNQTTDSDGKNIETASKCMREKLNSELMSTIFGSDSPSWTASVTVSPLETGPTQCLPEKPTALKPSQTEPDEKRDGSEVYSSHSPGQNWVKQTEPEIKEQEKVKKMGPVVDPAPSWSTASSLVDENPQWCGNSSNKPAVDESAVKSSDVASDHEATPTSGTIQISPCNVNLDWPPIVSENDFSLVDESVSDLLAEVEAMESLGGLPSPISRMQDCFTPGEFSPLHEQGKSDALSSSGDIHLPAHLVQNLVNRTHFPVELPLTDSFAPAKGEGVAATWKQEVAHAPVLASGFVGGSTMACGGSWGNRQMFLGLSNGHSVRTGPKGQRVCKYYENGCCRKGACCSYWHPGT